MRYLCIAFYRKPNGQIDEQVSVSKRVRTSDLVNNNIILDFGKKTVDKCVVEGNRLEKSFDELREYYHKIYPNLIEQLDKEAVITINQKDTGK